MFTLSGIEFFLFSVPNQVICMAGYENLLCYVYTVSPGLYGTQNFRFKIVDITNNFEDIIDDQLPISPYSTLVWLGFSEGILILNLDGMLITYDSDKIVRGFTYKMGKKWIPLLNLRDIYQSNVFVIGAQDEELYIVDLKNAVEPAPFQKMPIRVHKYKIPILREVNLKNIDNSKIDNIDLILNNLLFINHVYLLINLIGHLKAIYFRTHLVLSQKIIIRYGLFDTLEIPFDSIKTIQKFEGDYDKSNDLVKFALLGKLEPHNISIEESIPVNLPFGIRKQPKRILLYIDDVADFLKTVAGKIEESRDFDSVSLELDGAKPVFVV